MIVVFVVVFFFLISTGVGEFDIFHFLPLYFNHCNHPVKLFYSFELVGSGLVADKFSHFLVVQRIDPDENDLKALFFAVRSDFESDLLLLGFRAHLSVTVENPGREFALLFVEFELEVGKVISSENDESPVVRRFVVVAVIAVVVVFVVVFFTAGEGQSYHY